MIEDIFKYVRKRNDQELALMREKFQSAYPYPYLAIQDFLTDDFIKTLVEEFPSKEDPQYKEFCKEDGGKYGTNYSNCDPKTFPPAFKILDQLSQSPAFLKYLSAITGIEGFEYDLDYFGGGIRESQNGTFLPVHLDFNHHPRTLHHRRINLLLYLNQEWDEKWGGNIQVHLDPEKYKEKSLIASYPPAFNQCFIFETSETSWHGFDRLNLPPGKSRRAWTIYFYTQDRPNADKIKLRNTEYVEPSLAEHLKPGHTLTEADVKFLQEGYARRDQRIKMLYELRANFDSKYSFLWHEYEQLMSNSHWSKIRWILSKIWHKLHKKEQ